MRNNGPGFEDFVPFAEASALIPVRPVYRFGSGPPVLIMHEVFGATPTLFRFAHRVADRGFEAFVPILFGKANRPKDIFHDIAQIGHVCFSHEFSVLASRRSSPITKWLRDLARIIHTLRRMPIGAIGLCLTGNFALSMMLDEWTLAPVVSEPALPFAVTPKLRRALHLSDADIDVVRSRVDKGAKILAFRFEGDCLSPPQRYANMKRTFAPGVVGNGALRRTCRRAHSVFTEHFDATPGSSTKEAFETLVQFLSERLKSSH